MGTKQKAHRAATVPQVELIERLLDQTKTDPLELGFRDAADLSTGEASTNIDWLMTELRRMEKAAEAKALEGVEPIAEGRHAVTATVLRVKEKVGTYGVQVKMMLRDAEGRRYWVTVPAALGEPAEGSEVTVTATWERAEGENHFAFGTRPKAGG